MADRPSTFGGTSNHVYNLDFSGKTVLVVGGTSGIGNGVAQAFRAKGAEVHVWGTRPSREDYAGQAGSDLEGLRYAQMDVADFGALDAYRPPFEKLDILVTCQGHAVYGRKEFALDTFREVVKINLGSVMACCTKFHAMLEESRGNIVIVGSIAGFQSQMGNPAYSASKTAVVGLVRTLGEAWAKTVRVNSVAPGFVRTRLTEIVSSHPKRLERVLSQIPVGRLGELEDIAGAVLFLASDLASFMVGQTVIVDGGRLLE